MSNEKKLPNGFNEQVITILVMTGKCYGVITEQRADGVYALRWQERDGKALVPTDSEIEAAVAAYQLQVIKKLRADAMNAEADPLFFKSQRGEATEQEWLDKVTEIRNRFPYED